MANCRTCNHTIHSTVEKCPSCGDPEPHKTPLYMKILTVGIIIIVVIGWSAANL
jgi:hypothetical protein